MTFSVTDGENRVQVVHHGDPPELFKDGAPVKRIVGAKGKAALLRELADVV